ncbi:hypothetical protein CCACVL1_00026, partial [Corchorus capsularis]
VRGEESGNRYNRLVEYGGDPHRITGNGKGEE